MPLRGNIQTRLDKIQINNWDGAVFAQAGLQRLSTKPATYCPIDWMIPAPAQGAILVTAREDDPKLLEKIKPLSHQSSDYCVQIERAPFYVRYKVDAQRPLVPMQAFKTNAFPFTDV